MSTKNFVSYGDAETLFTGVGNKISGKQAKPTTISYADWLLLTPQQQETGNWLVTGVPGADLSLRVLALETNKQDKTDNNLQTTSKETTGAINELKSGLNGKVKGTVSGTNVPCTVVSTMHYTDDNTYNVWTTHTYTFSEFTNIACVFVQVINNSFISDGVQHEVEVLGFTGNVLTYAIKGGWSGGAAGVNVMIMAVGA